MKRPFVKLQSALARGLDWRLLLFWVLGMLLPTALMTVPIWRTLSEALDQYPLAQHVAERFDVLVFEDLRVTAQRSSPALAGGALVGLLLAVLVSPLLTAAIMASAAADERTFAGRATAWYGRALRLWLVSGIPLALLGTAWWALAKLVDNEAQRATLETRADLASRLSLWAIALLGIVLHTSIELGRAELAANPERRSALLAWLRGTRKAMRQPFRTLLSYVVPTVLSLFLAALLSVLRLHLNAASQSGFWLGALVTQLAVAVVGWGRASRLFALTALVRDEP